MKILKTPWKDCLLDLISQSSESVKITSPFIKENICTELLNAKRKNTSLELYTSFKLMNIYSGSLDLAGLENIIRSKGIVKNIPRLHSKVYLFDEKKIVITSGNLTNGGLINNVEYGIYTEDINVVSEVVKDFCSFASSKDVGSIKLKDIEAVRGILSKIPEAKMIKLPQYNLGDSEDKYDIIELPHDAITSSLKNGWKLEVFKCVQSIPKQNFLLKDINTFEGYLQKKFPKNNNVKAKIRQQLQILRDYGLIEFIGSGKYRKLWS